MFSSKQHYYILKFFGMFSVVRGYNIGLIFIAQYLMSIFIVSSGQSVWNVILDLQLLMLVLATSGTVASGYIINNFYDAEKDLINRPKKSHIDQMVGQNTKLMLYMILNGLVLLSAVCVSLKAVLFFLIYMFTIWIYSHKIKRKPLIGNLISTILTITPFFTIFIYYKNFKFLIFVLGFYLFLILSMREIIKDLENIKGDLALDYQTIPVRYGVGMAKTMVYVLIGLNLLITFYLLTYFDLGLMDYFFITSIVLLFSTIVLVYNAKTQAQYLRIHNLLKILIALGVFSIVLLDPQLILYKIL